MVRLPEGNGRQTSKVSENYAMRSIDRFHC